MTDRLRRIHICPGIIAMLCLVDGVAGLASAQSTEEMFQQALNTTGTRYFKARDRFLEKPDARFLRQKLESGSDDERVLATILLGWMANRTSYRELLNAETKTTRALRKHYPWARRDLLDKSAAPLLMEILLKGGSHENAKSDAALALGKMLRSGVKLNSGLFTIPFQDQDAETRRLLASVISELPPAPDGESFDELDRLFRSEDDTLAAQHLLAGMIRQAGSLSDEQKQDLVTELNTDNAIARLGEHSVYSALAGIGGKDAEAVLLEQAEEALKSTDESRQRDAVKVLFKLADPMATEMLLGLAQNSESPEHLRKLIHSGFADRPYGKNIETHLLDVVRNNTRSAAERSEAVKALDRIQDMLDAGGIDSRSIRDALREIQEGGIDDSGLLKSLQDAIDNGLNSG